jgi:hypothetical protein
MGIYDYSDFGKLILVWSLKECCKQCDLNRKTYWQVEVQVTQNGRPEVKEYTFRLRFKFQVQVRYISV